ncbi:Ulp1 family isopeptidase, partial [Mesorhizobium captivum]|uniref:Ulp1 family isopeptidase n=1 Tax=Mesorhizobium captivum TaxID=3072319 RepID=UPI002A24283A
PAAAGTSAISDAPGIAVDVPPGVRPTERQAAGLPPVAAAAHRLALGATQWLLDDHITADYALLGEALHAASPDIAARIRLVEPSVTHLLRMTEDEAEAAAIFHGIAGGGGNLADARADFVFLPLNNAALGEQGTHWSLLFVDLRGSQPLASHYDSSGGQNSALAQELAAKLGARLKPVLMAQQDNNYDCGVFVLDATRALTARLAEAEPPTGRPLHLDTLVADRQALLDRLRPLIGSGP